MLPSYESAVNMGVWGGYRLGIEGEKEVTGLPVAKGRVLGILRHVQPASSRIPSLWVAFPTSSSSNWISSTPWPLNGNPQAHPSPQVKTDTD